MWPIHSISGAIVGALVGLVGPKIPPEMPNAVALFSFSGSLVGLFFDFIHLTYQVMCGDHQDNSTTDVRGSRDVGDATDPS
jgi:hypothetical protein